MDYIAKFWVTKCYFRYLNRLIPSCNVKKVPRENRKLLEANIR